MKKTIKRTPIGGMSPAALVFVGTVVLMAVLIWWLRRPPTSPTQTGVPLVVYCAAGLKPPIEEIARQYQQQYGVAVQLQYGGSQTLLAALEVARRGDLYLPGDDSFIQLARDKGLVAETIPLARMQVILAVARGNPKKIHRLEDLRTLPVTLAQASPEATAVGRLTRQALEKAGCWEAVAARTRVFKPTVNDVANDLKLGTVDAGFIFDALLAQYPELEAVPVPELEGCTATVMVGVLTSSQQPTAALRFARYLAARDRGTPILAKHGYRATGGDPWSETPELTLYAGAMLRPAIEKTIQEFEQREGVKVNRIYNGCGILVAQMRAGQRPDAYFACDKSFLTMVADLFAEGEDISSNPIIILVPKGNPKGIRELRDLGRPGLRVGVAHEQQSTLGALTRTLLQKHGLYDLIRPNVKVESATGDFLVNQLRAGSLDAVIVYVSNGALVSQETVSLPIPLPEAFAIQPYAVGKEARYPQLATRLHERIRAAESRQRFIDLGFGWRLGPNPVEPKMPPPPPPPP
ncbi:MAG: substrate-binding domain-containing protein [Verrucomicrobiae bacterium]|nr:substrate-binding domain-containing protein [Verrucomicrobiae bacterium]